MTDVSPGRLGDATTAAVEPGALVLVPLGSTEQHGPHLPLDVDSRVAARVAERVAGQLAGSRPVWVAPTLAFGSSGEHQAFPGTVSIGRPALEALLVELGRSLSTWAASTIFVNGHGGNLSAVAAAVRTLRDEGRDASWIGCTAMTVDAHAGRTETSLMLAIAPELVRPFQDVVGNPAPVSKLMPDLRASGVRPVSPSGVLGDPTGATSDEGIRVLDAMVLDGTTRCVSRKVDGNGQRLP